MSAAAIAARANWAASFFRGLKPFVSFRMTFL